MRKILLTEDAGHNERRGERGSALIYILIAIALLALLTIAFMEPSSQQTQSQGSFQTVSEIQSQIEFIRSAVQECVILHQSGDINITDPGANTRYPIRPDSAYLVGPAANRQVSNLRCPGNPGDDPNHVVIFGGATGKFMPPAPALFNDWQWYNGVDGVFFWIETNKTDAFIGTALQKLDDEFFECEADIVDASAGQVEMTSVAGVGDPKCPANNQCFRVWMITKGTFVYPVGSPEKLAGC